MERWRREICTALRSGNLYFRTGGAPRTGFSLRAEWKSPGLPQMYDVGARTNSIGKTPRRFGGIIRGTGRIGIPSHVAVESLGSGPKAFRPKLERRDDMTRVLLILCRRGCEEK